jgi:hypothetical protein
MKLPENLTPAEIRVLQEFRRFGVREMTMDQIKAIKHPVGGGEAPALSLVEKGYLSADEGRTRFTLTDKPNELLAYNPLPYSERG